MRKETWRCEAEQQRRIKNPNLNPNQNQFLLCLARISSQEQEKQSDLSDEDLTEKASPRSEAWGSENPSVSIALRKNEERERRQWKCRERKRVGNGWEWKIGSKSTEGGLLYGGYGYRYTSSGGLALLSVGCPRGVPTKAWPGILPCLLRPPARF